MSLTEDQRIAWRIQGIGPDPAHPVAVFAKVGLGRVLYKILQPGEVLKLGWFSSMDTYVSYAISSEEHLRHSFSRKILVTDQTRTITLHFELALQVEDVQALAIKFENGDPLQALEGEVARLIGATARHLPWEMVRKEGPHFGLSLLETESVEGFGEKRRNSDRLQAFAKSLGLSLNHIDITRTLSEVDVATDLEEKESLDKIRRIEIGSVVAQVEYQAKHVQDLRRSENQWELDQLAAQRKQTLEGMERLKGVLDGIAREGVRVTAQGVDSIRSFPALREALVEIQGIQSGLSALVGGRGYAPALQAGASAGQFSVEVLPAANPTKAWEMSSDPLKRLVGQTFHSLKALDENREERLQLRAAALHLLAEASLGDKADKEFVALCREGYESRLSLVESALEGEEERDFLRKIADIGQLRQELE